MPKVHKECPICGGNITFHFTCSVAAAERKALRLMEEGHICDTCQQDRRTKQNEAAAIEAEQSGLPNLVGSEKQVSWANSIRQEQLQELADVESVNGSAENALTYIKRLARQFEITPQKICATCVTVAQAQTKASLWIDNRYNLADMLEALEMLVSKKLREEVESESDEATQVKAEATLRPQQVQHDLLVEVAVSANAVTAALPEPIDAFTVVVKRLGYRWRRANQKWYIEGGTIGQPEDRAAELIHALLQAGFLVCCMDEAAREKAITATFEPRHPRWLALMANGKIRITWDDPVELDAEVKKISGIRKQKDRCYYAASTEWQDLLGMADEHSFKLTEAASAALERAKAIEHAQLLVQELPDAPKQKEVKSKAIILPDSNGVDPSLLDD